MQVTNKLSAEPNSAQIHYLMTAYLSSKALFMGLEFGLFDKLSIAPATVEELSEGLQIEERPVRVLLNACIGNGLIEQNGDYFSNTAVANSYLVSGSPTYMGDLALHQNQHFNNFSRLSDAIRTNTSITGRVQKDGYANQGAAKNEDNEGTKRFIKALHGSAVVQAEALASSWKIKENHLVDLGCGSGAYSIAFAKANPHLKVTAMDYPAVIDVVQTHIDESKLGEQIKVHKGDLFNDELPGNPEAVLLSHVLDGYGAEKAQEVLERIYRYLPSGGRLLLHSHSASRAKAPYPYLFGLILLANTAAGEVHNENAIMNWLSNAGFNNIEIIEVSPISVLYTCVKPF